MKEIELLKIIFKNSPDILEPLNEIDKEIERLNTDKEQLNSLVNSCQEEIRRLHSIIKELKEEMENTKNISVEDVYHIIEHEKKLNEILDKV